jgi:hypothetical protein
MAQYEELIIEISKFMGSISILVGNIDKMTKELPSVKDYNHLYGLVDDLDDAQKSILKTIQEFTLINENHSKTFISNLTEMSKKMDIVNDQLKILSSEKFINHLNDCDRSCDIISQIKTNTAELKKSFDSVTTEFNRLGILWKAVGISLDDLQEVVIASKQINRIVNWFSGWKKSIILIFTGGAVLMSFYDGFEKLIGFIEKIKSLF